VRSCTWSIAAALDSAYCSFERAEAIMPTYEFFCHACSKPFSKTLTLAEYEEGEVVCPDCGSDDVEQRISKFYAVTSKKSA
ncbi:MAG TPA: zinc ribbon domain-containing protein, partial [Terriglobales bacterium]